MKKKITLRSIAINLFDKLALIILFVFIAQGLRMVNGYSSANKDGDKPLVEDSEAVIELDWAVGYAGKVPVFIELHEDGTVDTVGLGDNYETIAYVRKLSRRGFFDSWDGMTLSEVAVADVDAVSGVTFTARAVIENVKKLAAEMTNTVAVIESPYTAEWIAERAALLAVFLLALFSYFFPKRSKSLRWVLLVASIGVLGVWQGSFISFQLLYNYVINGPLMNQIGLFIILVISILLPLLLNKQFYCTYLCPFGAAQELTSKIPVKKWKLGVKVTRYFKWVRKGVFVLFTVLLFTVSSFSPDEWEPFSAFSALRDFVNFTGVSVLIIASVSLVLSVFVPKVWCRAFCPVGEFFSQIQKPDLKRLKKK
ncbi:MAG: 4Fe-4S binding protein [Rikenellaceae bacterium]